MNHQKPTGLCCRLPIAWVFVVIAVGFGRQPVAAQISDDQVNAAESTAMKRVPTLPAGLTVGSTKTDQRWNRVLLLATPKFNSGDIDKLSDSIRKAATGLTLTIMATIEPSQDKDEFELRELGIGYSVSIAGQQTVITSATQSQLGANLGFIQRRVLTSNELGLADFQYVVQTTTLAIIDAPAVMHRDAEHREYVMRHLVWIDSKTGTSAMLVWALSENANGKLVPADEPLRVVAAGTKEKRCIHVDGSEFTLGFPSDRAFALENLPPGVDVVWTEELAAVAALPSYDAKTLVTLSAAVNKATSESSQQ